MKAQSDALSEKPRIVELVGVPGAGKSSLCTVARDRFTATGGTAWDAAGWRRSWLTKRSTSLARRLYLKIATVLTERRVLAITATALLRSDLSWRLRLLALRLVLVNLECHRCAAKHLPPGHVIVVDEGLLQLAVRLFLSTDGSGYRDPLHYAQSIPAPDLIVHVRAPQQRAVERARGRQRGLPRRLQSLGPAEVEVAMTEAARLIDRLVDRVLASNPQCRLVEIDAAISDDARRQVETLMDRLSAVGGDLEWER